jgi:hypothetical protein
MRQASDIEMKTMLCPKCGEQMPYYGGSAGFIHCGFKFLYGTADGSTRRGYTSETTVSPEETAA